MPRPSRKAGGCIFALVLKAERLMVALSLGEYKCLCFSATVAKRRGSLSQSGLPLLFCVQPPICPSSLSSMYMWLYGVAYNNLIKAQLLLVMGKVYQLGRSSGLKALCVCCLEVTGPQHVHLEARASSSPGSILAVFSSRFSSGGGVM